MTPEQIIAEIWKLPWYQVARVAFVDDFILMYKLLPAIIALLVFVFGTLSFISILKKMRMKKKIENCSYCHQLFSDPDTFLDEPDIQDTIVITSKINKEFIVSIHRKCAEEWVHELNNVGISMLGVERTEYLAEIIAKHLKEKYSDITFLQIEVVKHG